MMGSPLIGPESSDVSSWVEPWHEAETKAVRMGEGGFKKFAPYNPEASAGSRNVRKNVSDTMSIKPTNVIQFTTRYMTHKNLISDHSWTDKRKYATRYH